MLLPPDIFEKVFNLIGDAIFIKDSRHRFVMLNDASCRAIGKPRENILGRSDRDFFPTEEADVFWDRDEKVFRTGLEDINEETHTPVGGSHRTLLTRKQLYFDPRGNPYIVGIFKDITPIKLAEEGLRNANLVLEDMVRARTTELRRANAEMQVRIGQLDYLNEKARTFAHLSERDDVLDEVLAAFSGLFPGSAIQVVLPDQKGVRVARHAGIAPGTEEILEARLAPLLTQDSGGIAAVAAGAALTEAYPGISGYLWIPFRHGTEFLGGVCILHPAGWERRFDADQPLLGALSAQAAAALEYARVHAIQREKARIEDELRMAHNIQGRYVPDAPDIPGITVAGACLPAREIGGDYLDYFRNERGDWIVVIADVCGKGIPAALVMTSLRSCVRAEGRRQGSSKEVLAAVNSLMGPELRRERTFITCLCLVISSRGDRVNFTRAGHPWLVASGADPRATRALVTQGIALGLVPDDDFRARTEEAMAELRPGDRLVAYTDGVDEAKDAEGRPFGRERLYSLLHAGRHLPPSQVIEAVLAEVRNHTGEIPQYDDMTLFCLDKLG